MINMSMMEVQAA